MLKGKLQIILITFNRAEWLKNTLNSVLSENSPVKDFDITVVDNNSTDNTGDIVKGFCARFPNLKYKKNRYNIGGNANIARAFEMPEKEYFWILCDDDLYDWSAWSEVEKAIESNPDVVIVSREQLKKQINLGTITKQLTFLPSGIYKTANITDDVIHDAQFNIPFLFPHLSIVCALINSKKIDNRVVVSKDIVIPDNLNRKYLRGINSSNAMARNTLWITGFINSIQLVEDSKTRKYILDHLLVRPLGFFSIISAEFKYNRLYCGNSFKNICDVFCGISIGQKFQFLLALVWLDVIYFIKKFILRNKKYIGEK